MLPMSDAPIRFPNSDKFIEHCAGRYADIKQVEPDYRYGQHVFNELYRHRPDLSEQIRGTRMDPFYRNHISSELEQFLLLNW